MTIPSYLEIEQALCGVREGRCLIMKSLVDHISCGNVCAEPFLAISRFFCRLKSADSIVEKLKRKGIQTRDASEIPDRMPDTLGFRIILANNDELAAIDDFVRSRFEIVRRRDRMATPGEFGERGMEYSARYHTDKVVYQFELQLRTFLQHYWAGQSFHLFHKQPRECAVERKGLLVEFSEALARAEDCAQKVAASRAFGLTTSTLVPGMTSLFKRVHLIVIEPGEQFVDHVVHSLSGNGEADHASIVTAKMGLYSTFPDAAIVECSCLNFLSFHLNEPLVQVPMSQMERTRV